MFRALGKSKIAFVLAILFGVSLFFFKGGSRYSNLFNSDNVVATVSGTPISTSKFNRTMKMNIDQFGQMLGKKLSSDEIIDFQLQNLVLGSLINNAVFENEFDKIKFIVDDTIIAKKTKERLPQLYDSNNKLNELALNSFLSQQGLKIDDLVDIINFETKAEVFENIFFQINFPNKINDKINIFNAHEREIEYSVIKLNEFLLNDSNYENLSKEKKEIIEFYNNNLNNYMTEEARDISYIIIDSTKFKDQFLPTESEIKDYYNKNQNIFSVPEKRDFIQFNFQSNDEANKFFNNVNMLQIDEVIQYANINNIKFSKFKNLSKNEVLDELSNEIFNLNIGEISKTVDTTLAKHIIIVEKIIEEKLQNLGEVKSEINELMLNVELNNYVTELKNNISKDIVDGLGIVSIADKYNLEILKSNKVNNVVKKQNDSIKNEIIKQGFITNKDFVTDVIDYDQNISFLLNVDNIYLPANIKYDEIFDVVLNDWLINEKKDFIKKEFKINDNYLSYVSTNYKNKIKLITVDKNSSSLPPKLIKEIFNNEINNQFLYFDEESEIYIVEIKDIIIDKDYINSKNSLSLNSELKNAFGSEIIKNKKISTNDALLNGLINTY